MGDFSFYNSIETNPTRSLVVVHGYEPHSGPALCTRVAFVDAPTGLVLRFRAATAAAAADPAAERSADTNDDGSSRSSRRTASSNSSKLGEESETEAWVRCDTSSLPRFKRAVFLPPDFQRALMPFTSEIEVDGQKTTSTSFILFTRQENTTAVEAATTTTSTSSDRSDDGTGKLAGGAVIAHSTWNLTLSNASVPAFAVEPTGRYLVFITASWRVDDPTDPTFAPKLNVVNISAQSILPASATNLSSFSGMTPWNLVFSAPLPATGGAVDEAAAFTTQSFLAVALSSYEYSTGDMEPSRLAFFRAHASPAHFALEFERAVDAHPDDVFCIAAGALRPLVATSSHNPAIKVCSVVCLCM